MWMEEEVLQQWRERRRISNATRDGKERSLLLQPRLPQILGDIHGNVEEREVGDGEALALEAEKTGGGQECVERGGAAIIADAATATKPATSRIQRCMDAANKGK
jgi:hypothetical protein